jgi:hypothetical protein
MFEYPIIILSLLFFIIIFIYKYKATYNKNHEKQKLIDIINKNIYDNNVNNNINILLSYYHNNGYILLARVKNDLLRDKKRKLHMQMFNIIRNLSDKILIKQEIKKINREMILYTYELNNIILKMKNNSKIKNDVSYLI